VRDHGFRRVMTMEEPSWREIEHTADLALEVWGTSRSDLFRNAALGVAGLLGGRPAGERYVKRFYLEAPDSEILLVDWLSELLFWLEEDDLVLVDAQVEAVTETSLIGDAAGRKGADLGRHIKAVTFNDLAIRSTPEGFETTIVFDV
jgi:SHS2 domain-containing protein